MKVIIVTGCVATGKTTLSKKIAARLKFHYIDVNELIKEHNLAEGYDKKREASIIDTKKLNKILINIISNLKESLVIDSHLSHYMDKKYVDLCIVTKCNLKELKKRLEKRNYSKEKIRENLDADIFDVCLNEAKEEGHNVLVVETDKKMDWEELPDKIKNSL